MNQNKTTFLGRRIGLNEEQRKMLAYGRELYITFSGKVMHFFDPQTSRNLIYG